MLASTLSKFIKCTDFSEQQIRRNIKYTPIAHFDSFVGEFRAATPLLPYKKFSLNQNLTHLKLKKKCLLCTEINISLTKTTSCEKYPPFITKSTVNLYHISVV